VDMHDRFDAHGSHSVLRMAGPFASGAAVRRKNLSAVLRTADQFPERAALRLTDRTP